MTSYIYLISILISFLCRVKMNYDYEQMQAHEPINKEGNQYDNIDNIFRSIHSKSFLTLTTTLYIGHAAYPR